MLGGRFVGEVQRDLYERDALPLFSSIILIGVGVGRDLSDEPQIVTGSDVPLAEAFDDLGGRTYDRLSVRIHNFDPTLAPQGKTVLTCMLEADEPVLGALARGRQGTLRGREAAGGRRRRRDAREALPRPDVVGRDDRCEHAGHAGALHGQLARELRGLAAHA